MGIGWERSLSCSEQCWCVYVPFHRGNATGACVLKQWQQPSAQNPVKVFHTPMKANMVNNREKRKEWGRGGIKVWRYFLKILLFRRWIYKHVGGCNLSQHLITSVITIYSICNILLQQSHYHFLFPWCVIDLSGQWIVITFHKPSSFFISVPSEQTA